MAEQLQILVFVVGGAALIPLIARRFQLPSAALEILFGIILFNTLLKTQPEWFLLLKEIGFIYLMFIAGMELDISALIKDRRSLWYVLIPLLSLLILPLLFQQLGYPFFLGIAAATLSAGIIIPVLKESNLTQSPLGQDAVGIALIGELICIAMLTGLEVYVHYGLTVNALLQGVKLIILLAAAALLLKIIYVFSWWHPEWVKKIMESEDPVEEGMRAIVFAAMAGALAALNSGVEAILGSFMAGMIFSQVFKSKGKFEEKINALGFGFLTPFFFIGLGAGFNITLLTSPDLLFLALILTFMLWVGKTPPLFFASKMQLSIRESLGLSFLLATPLSMIAVSGAVGQKIGLINDTQQGALILTALLSSLLFPLLFKLTVKKSS